MIQEDPTSWDQGFHGSEHPKTAAIRVRKEFVEHRVALKRENMDHVYAYMTELLDKAKEELGHCRSGGSAGDHRRMALKQHVDEIGAYLKGQGLDIAMPETYGEEGGAALAHHYVLEEVPPYFGRVKCVLDQWFDSHLIAVYDEMLTLVSLKGGGRKKAPPPPSEIAE
ncbi:MAG: hypothetical protein R3D89_11400 [Sphingomonadaceae bacterium]